MAKSGLRFLSRLSLAVAALAVSACSGTVGPSPSHTVAVEPANTCTDGGAHLYRIAQDSMEPTLEPGDLLVVGPANDAVGEIVVFEPPPGSDGSGQNVPWIKRVVAVGGDTVEIRNGAVWVNDVKLNEPYVYEGQATDEVDGQTAWQVPKGDLFVLGDHRDLSMDSRAMGPIAISSVIGMVTYRCSPAARQGPVT